MWESEWENIKNKHNDIMRLFSECNDRIINGDYLEYPNPLDIAVYLDILTAHIINILIDDETLYMPNHIVSYLDLHESKIMDFVEWDIKDNNYFLRQPNSSQKYALLKNLITVCFNEEHKNNICEICAQDIITNKKLAKKISELLNSIYLVIELTIKGEEEFLKRLSAMRTSSISMIKNTKIQRKYDTEYRNRGALIRNRVFKHNYNGNMLSNKVIIQNESEEILDYRIDKNFCQSALLHIGVESSGSCGTGFVISEDGYALTCAHVVENAKEVYATIIIGDGYVFDNDRDSDGFEVYDAGDAEVIYVNKQLDIALLKMGHFGFGFLPVEQRKILPELGEEVVVFGYPLGYEMPQSNFFGPNISFYKGYVSSNQVKDGNSVTFLDIDVKSGNSGSPVISAKTGKVIGIMSGIKIGGRLALNEKMPYMIPIQHFIELNK